VYFYICLCICVCVHIFMYMCMCTHAYLRVYISIISVSLWISCIHMDITCCNPRRPIDMGRLRSVGSLKLQVSFAEYHLFYRALLQKRPIVLQSLLIVATPYDDMDIIPCRYYHEWSGEGLQQIQHVLGPTKCAFSAIEFRSFYLGIL